MAALTAHRTLGASGLRVAPLCLGTMTFGAWGTPEDDARAQIDLYAEHGGNFIDTAIDYGRGTSEPIVGTALAGRRDKFVLATKFSFLDRDGDPTLGGNSRKAMVRAIEISLGRLKTDYIDVYFIHAWESRTPIEEVLRAMDDLVRAGKVLYAGIDNTPAWKVSEANTIARYRGWTAFSAYEGPYNLTERTVERDLTAMCADQGIGYLAHSPLASGLFSGRFGADDAMPLSPEDAARPENARKAQLQRRGILREATAKMAAAVNAIAAALGCSSSQVALAWLLARPNRPIPVLGARNLTQLEDNLGCLAVTLNAEQLALLDGLSAVELGEPQTTLASPFIHGGMVGPGLTLERKTGPAVTFDAGRGA
jgi:aryl-alcohol dehydrogenase-like predicted oxidoreductase